MKDMWAGCERGVREAGGEGRENECCGRPHRQLRMRRVFDCMRGGCVCRVLRIDCEPGMHIAARSRLPISALPAVGRSVWAGYIILLVATWHLFYSLTEKSTPDRHAALPSDQGGWGGQRHTSPTKSAGHAYRFRRH